MLKVIAAIVSMLIGLLLGPTQGDTVSNDHHYSNQTPYGDPVATMIRTPPAGYELAFLEMLGRHGARSLTNDKPERRALAVWRAAERQGALTETGRRFADDLSAFQRAEKSIGYGRLSAVGAREWRGIGRRTADNYRDFLADVAERGEAVELRTSPIRRTQQSADAMQSGLESRSGGLRFAPRVVDLRLLIVNGATDRGNAAIASTKRRHDVRTAARHVLRTIYTRAYVDRIEDPVAAALDIYLLYCTAPGMAGETDVTFARYVPRAAARVLASAKDAQNFYRYGPGVAGESSSYRQAVPVLDDFFERLDQRVAGGRTAAVFRVGHGETTMPFAALIQLPGSQKQASTPFSYRANPWRGHVAGRLAGNIEWAAYRNASRDVIVTMRYNERPVQFRASCEPIAADAYFYSVAELKTCLRPR